MCGVVAMGGVAVITRPPLLTGGEPFSMETLIGASLAFGGMAVSVGVFVMLRLLRHVHYATVSMSVALLKSVLCFALSAAVNGLENETVVGRLPFQLPEGMDDWLKAGALGFATFLHQIMLVLSLHYERAELIALVDTCTIPFSYAFQYIFLHEVPDQLSVIGGVVVIGCVVVASLRKVLEELPDDSGVKRKCWVLLK